MIYILRHQEGERHTNCLSKKGICDSYSIANITTKMYNRSCFRTYVYTMLPTLHGKHVRPIQTATIMCSAMKKSLNLLEKEDIFPSNNDNYNHIIVWHHHEIPKILQKYFRDASFVWDDDNYYGCLLIDEKEWKYKPEFYEEKWKMINYCCI